MNEIAVPRDTAGRFLKGHGGNPSGRPSDLREITALARSHSPKMLQVLVDIANDPEQPVFARVQAAQHVLDRGLGKPPQAIAVATGASSPEAFSQMLDVLRSGGPISRERLLPLIEATAIITGAQEDGS
jgi:hypothetical protein